MFEQLKVKVAIRQTITLGLMLIFILSLIYLYNYSKMLITIEQNLDKISARPFFDNQNDEQVQNNNLLYQRDSLSIYINNENVYFPSEINFYTDSTIKAIINYVAQSEKHSDKIRVDGNQIAYRTETNPMGRFIYLYDYTIEFDALKNVGIIIAVAGSLSIVAVAIFSIQWAKKSVLPIESAFTKQQELVANASHELKTPLTIINTDLSILNSFKDSYNEEQIKWLDSINNQVGRMSMLINDMLELARMDAVVEKPIFESVNLSEIGYQVVLGSEVLAYENDIALNSNIDSDIKISGVSASIEKLVYILVENAIKYTNKGGSVDVSIYADRKKAVFKVKNTGDGIEEKYLPKLFDRFYRTDESHTTSGSFGLGLSIAKAIVDSHSATIGVDSKVGEYTEFVVIFKEA